MLEDRLGRLWVGTWGGGLDEETEDKVRVYGTTNQLSSDLILGLCEGHDGSIWAGADNGGGLFRLKNQGVKHYTCRDGLIDGAISALHEDQKGNLWIGTRQGLCRFSDGVFITEANSQSGPVRAICEDARGQLWFGGETGLVRWRDGAIDNLSSEGAFPHDTVSALYAGVNDNLWVGTLSGGLLRWQGGHWDRFDTQDGLFSNEVLGITEYHGWLWLTSTQRHLSFACGNMIWTFLIVTRKKSCLASLTAKKTAWRVLFAAAWQPLPSGRLPMTGCVSPPR